MFEIGPLLLIATLCHSITHRYTFAMWLVRRSANYSLHHPPQASRLSPGVPALSKGRKAFQNVIPASEEQKLRLFHGLLAYKWQNVFACDHTNATEPWEVGLLVSVECQPEKVTVRCSENETLQELSVGITLRLDADGRRWVT